MPARTGGELVRHRAELDPGARAGVAGVGVAAGARLGRAAGDRVDGDVVADDPDALAPHPPHGADVVITRLETGDLELQLELLARRCGGPHQDPAAVLDLEHALGGLRRQADLDDGLGGGAGRYDGRHPEREGSVWLRSGGVRGCGCGCRGAGARRHHGHEAAQRHDRGGADEMAVDGAGLVCGEHRDSLQGLRNSGALPADVPPRHAPAGPESRPHGRALHETLATPGGSVESRGAHHRVHHRAHHRAHRRPHAHCQAGSRTPTPSSASMAARVRGAAWPSP